MPDDESTKVACTFDVREMKPIVGLLEAEHRNGIASGHRILLSNPTFENDNIGNQREKCPKVELPKTEMSPSSAISKLSISRGETKPPSKAKKRLNVAPAASNKLLTDFFPVRRSERKCRSNILKEKKQFVEECIRTGNEEGLKVENVIGKGRGVIATKLFHRGDFVVEYSGELITTQEAKMRERVYATDENKGCYMYYFTFRNKQYCVDATAESAKLGRLVNHSRQGNLCTKTFVVDNVPHLVLIARRDIKLGEELLYDYGDRSRVSLTLHPWLAT